VLAVAFLVPIKPGSERVPVEGAARVGQVYRRPTGQLVLVTKK
jgi:hypothetical protein